MIVTFILNFDYLEMVPLVLVDHVNWVMTSESGLGLV